MTTASPPVTTTYPFSAIVGQDDMKLVLTLALLEPRLGGVLLRGEKGTAKSTAARALARFLDDEVKTPFVNLPLNTTPDRLLGSLHLEHAVREGRVAWEPGLVQQADGGILYVDEVNLLELSLVEALLDVAASGVVRIEREGFSLTDSARFVLIGSMNPEEGQISPQLLDRFGLACDIRGAHDIAERVETMRRRLAFDNEPRAFVEGYFAEEERLRTQIAEAKRILPAVRVEERLRRFMVEIALTHKVAGHRAELLMERAARAHAALHGRLTVTVEDITTVAPFVLLHRSRQSGDTPPPPPPPAPPDGIEQQEEQPEKTPSAKHQQPPQEHNDSPGDTRSDQEDLPSESPEGSRSPSVAPGIPFTVQPLAPRRDRKARRDSGRRSVSLSETRRGRYYRPTAQRRNSDIALDATLRAAAPHQPQRRRDRPEAEKSVHLQPHDIREKVRRTRVGSLLLFVVDASGSMGAQRRMREAKTAVLSLLHDAYRKRDMVGFIAFRGNGAETLLPPSVAPERAARLLHDLPSGGRTPLTAGLMEVSRVLSATLRRKPLLQPVVIVITDGRANAAVGRGKPLDEALQGAAWLAEGYPSATFLVVDAEPDRGVRLGLARQLATTLNATYLTFDNLRADRLVAAVHQAQESPHR